MYRDNVDFVGQVHYNNSDIHIESAKVLQWLPIVWCKPSPSSLGPPEKGTLYVYISTHLSLSLGELTWTSKEGLSS